MLYSKKKISRKLLIFVFSVSFILIVGSFIFFYISGKAFLHNSAKKELDIYKNLFEKSSLNQIEDYNNEMNGYFVEFRVKNIDENSKREKIISYFELNKGIIDELYLLDKTKNNMLEAIPVKIFWGEQIINFYERKPDKFYSLQDSIITLHDFNKSSTFGFYLEGDTKNYYLVNNLNNYIIIIKLNGISLFEKIVERVYHPSNVKFNIVNSRNVIEYSTDKFWINQKLDKYLGNNDKSEKYFWEDKIICGKWNSNIFNNFILITNDITPSYNDFYNISYKLLFYSIVIYLLIAIFALIYANKISKSLNEISSVSKSVGEGNFENKIHIKRDDELGQLVNSFNKMVDNLKVSYIKLNLTNEELEQKINELVKTKTELTKQQKLALIGETISKISHEMQNKISGISVWVQNLEMQCSLDENTLIYVEEIKKSLNSFVEMLFNFKKFYRKPFLEKSIFNYTELIDSIIELYKADINAKNIKVYKNIDLSNEKIFGDKNLIEEALINIFVNAIYFTPQNGHITFKSEIEKENLITIIADDGDGIDESDIDKVFNPFFTTKSSGSGLGMAITKNIIEAHNGKIELKNRIPSGTEFIMTIPLSEK